MIIDKALSKVFGTKHERDVKAMQPRVAAINALEPEIKALSDDAIRARVAGIRARVQEGLKTLPENIEERRAVGRYGVRLHSSRTESITVEGEEYAFEAVDIVERFSRRPSRWIR